jgi:hypothetical protein
MTHPFHRRVGDVGRYSGAATIPRTPNPMVPAAALVAFHDRIVPVDPMYRQLDAYPADQPVREVRLAPITVCDFYAKACKEAAHAKQ